MSARTITCGACGVTLPAGKNGTWADRHKCSHAGLDASDPAQGFKRCPAHNSLVWAVGPYTTFRACGSTGCTAGSKGKSWRYFSARDGKATPPADEAPEVKAPEAPRYEAPKAPDRTPESKAADEIKAANTPTPKVEVTPTPTPGRTLTTSTTPTALALKSLGSLGDMIAEFVEMRAHEIAVEASLEAIALLPERGAASVEWTVNSKPFAKIDGTHHKALPRLLKLYAAGFRNFLIVGPAGSGKTTLSSNLATALGRSHGSVSCTAGMSESALTGRAIPNLTTGATSYQSTDFVRSYETGGVFLLDEVDAADPNVMLAINSALANGHMPLPNREESPSAARHEDSVIICAANTWGTGADRQYVGRNQLDAAFLDRFVGATVEVDYDRDLESSLTGDANICARVWEIRSKVADLKLRRVVGTRFLLSVTRLVKGAGETINEALLACTTGWTNDERTKVGVRL